MRKTIRHPGLWLALIIGALQKALLLITGSVTFDSDEAIMALMARHILQGERPIFFYGQSYMGALDSYLIAPMYLLVGERVFAVRLVQIILYLGVIATTYFIALRLTESDLAAGAAALLIALPTVLFNLYTISTLGNYVETLLLNNILWLIVIDILDGRKKHPGWWLLAGILAGVGWWAMALIVVSVGPLALLGLWHYRPGSGRAFPWGKTALLVLGFAIGAFPWILASIQRGAGATVSDLSGSWFSGNPEDRGYLFMVGFHLLTLALFNLPALFGLRAPWSADFYLLPVGLLVFGLYVLVIIRSIQRVLPRSPEPAKSPPPSLVGEGSGATARLWLISLLGGWGILLLLFIFTPFGGDPTGRYLLPLYPPLAVLSVWWLQGLRSGAETSISVEVAQKLAPGLFGLLIAFNIWGNAHAMIHNPPGLTTQFDLISHIPHDYDDDLIAFLDSIGVDRGYSNYWVTYRFAFLTHERIIFTPRLPYKESLHFTYGDERYPLYTQMVEEADEIVYITSNHPELDRLMRERLAEKGVLFEEKQIGYYTVFYHLSRRITPEELGPFGEVSGRAIHGGE